MFLRSCGTAENPVKPDNYTKEMAIRVKENVKIISKMIASDSTMRSAADAQGNPVLCFREDIARFVIRSQKLE